MREYKLSIDVDFDEIEGMTLGEATEYISEKVGRAEDAMIMGIIFDAMGRYVLGQKE